jgi:hypothetical protein
MCNSVKPIMRYELIEVQVTSAAAGQINFPSAISTLENNPDRKIIIQDIEIFPIYAQANSVRQNSVGGFPVSDISKVSVTIYYDGANFIRNIPAAKLIYTVPPSGVTCPYQFQRVQFSDLYPVAIDQCFVQFTSAPSGQYVIPIGISYTAVKVAK